MPAKLTKLPKREWATSEECVDMIRGLLKCAESGEITEFCYVANRRGDDFQSGATRSNNVFATGGYMINLAMRMMGFQDQGNRQPLPRE